MLEEKVTVKNSKSVQEVSKQHGKTDVRYWQKKIFKPTYTRDGKRFELDHYAVKLQHQGNRDNFKLGTPNSAAAAAKARDIYVFMQANGWQAAVAKYKSPRESVTQQTDSTIGDFLEELKATTGRHKTIEGYAQAFRLIVSDIFGIDAGNSRYDYYNGGRDAWAAQIHAVKLRDVTSDLIQRWKVRFLDRAGNNPIKQRTAKISVNSLIRQARSLFGKKMTKHLRHVVVPSPSPFDRIDFEEKQDMRYRSTFDVLKLIQAAREELAEPEPEQFKIFLLAVMAGLRRDEIDTLEWASFLWSKNAIRIERTENFSPKSEKSLGDIDCDPELLAIFRGYKAKATGAFVIESKNQHRAGTYRCQRHIEALLKWLRAKGVKSSKPLHSLRKEFGSLLTEQHGIFVASRMLRHSSVAITEAHYSDRRGRASVGLGHMLAESNVVKFSDKKEAV